MSWKIFLTALGSVLIAELESAFFGFEETLFTFLGFIFAFSLRNSKED